MKRPFSVLFLSPVLALAVNGAAMAQEDGSQVVLPLEAQTCDLPTAPPRIPDDATYDQLVEAKGKVSEFQGELQAYRDCLEGATDPENLTEGNRIALNDAHNYSVSMEERVAEQFNVAVRSYKARQSKEEG